MNDRLDDIFGDNLVAAEPKALPQDAASVRIRETVPQFAETCPKCRGTGRFIGYTGRPLGQCFTCKGAGKRTFATSPQTRARAAERRVEQKAAVAEQFAADHPIEAKWLNDTIERIRHSGKSQGYLQFLLDLRAASVKYGHLTENQLASVAKGIARDAEFAAQRVQKASEPKAVLDVTAIRKVLESRKKVMVALFTFSMAPAHGNNPGAIYVKDDGAYVGKIPAGASTFAPGRDFDQSRLPALVEAMADPAAAVKADAARRAQLLLEDPAMTIPCGCCGLTLSNPESIARGIGPICAGKWGF